MSRASRRQAKAEARLRADIRRDIFRGVARRFDSDPHWKGTYDQALRLEFEIEPNLDRCIADETPNWLWVVKAEIPARDQLARVPEPIHYQWYAMAPTEEWARRTATEVGVIAKGLFAAALAEIPRPQKWRP